MNKQELVHLHSLALELAAFCAATDGLSVDLDAYRALGTGPLSVHRSKPHHRAAVFALLAGLTPAMRAAMADEAPPAVG